MPYIILSLLFAAVTLHASPVAPPEFETPQDRLLFFCGTNNVEGVKAALAEGADVDEPWNESYLPLHLAIIQQHAEVFNYLLKSGADIDQFCEFSHCNALSFAAIYDRREMALKLLDAGADPNATKEVPRMKEYSAIAYAALYGNVDILRLFAARGGDLERPLLWPMWRDLPAEFPLLSVAAQHGGLEVVRYLVEERGHAVNPPGEIPVLPPLSVAVRYNNAEVAEYLIAKGADVNAEGYDYYNRSSHVMSRLSPLGVAAVYGRDEMAKLLFGHGAKFGKNINDDEPPIYRADWAGYYRVIEELERQGYSFDTWSVIERQYLEKDSKAEPEPELETANQFMPSFLRKHSRQWEVDDETELSAPLRLAVIADEGSTEVADLLTVTLSGTKHLELVERSALHEVLREQKLTMDGLTNGETLSRLADLLNAEALVLLETLNVNNQQVFQLRLVNSILGLQYGRHFVEDNTVLVSSLENYANRVGSLTNTFRRNYSSAIPVSLVNVRADLGTVEGLKIENTLKQLLQLELLGQSSVILTQRDSLETLIREKELGGREEAFQASSIFLDIGVQLDATGQKVSAYTVRIQPASGDATTLELAAENKSLEEAASAICRSVMSRIEGGYAEVESGWGGELSKDAETYFKEAMWHYNLGQFESSLEAFRTSISLGYNERKVWDYYFLLVQEMIDARRIHRGFDANNRAVLALERERLIALEGVLKLYRSDIPRRDLRTPRLGLKAFRRQDLRGFVTSLVRMRPVALQRRYDEELKNLERHLLRLINDYIIPCYADPMPHGKYPLDRYSRRALFEAVDLMAQLDESEYEEALNGLMEVLPPLVVSRNTGRPIYMGHLPWTQPPVASPRWTTVSLKYLDNRNAFLRSLYRLRVSYEDAFSRQKAPPVPISVLDRQQLVHRVKQAAGMVEGEGMEASREASMRKLAFDDAFGLERPEEWDPQEGIIPRSFERYGAEHETWMIQYVLAKDFSRAIGKAKEYKHPKTLKMAMEAYKAEFEGGRFKGKKWLESIINEFEQRYRYLTSSGQESEWGQNDGVQFGALPIRLWSPEKNASSEFASSGRFIHPPVAHEGSWWGLAVDQLDTNVENRRLALLRVDPETLETQVRWLDHAPILTNKICYASAATIAGQWLAIVSPKRPITLINIESLETKTLPGYIPSCRSMSHLQSSMYAYEDEFLFFVQPVNDFEDIHQWEEAEMQMLIRYDPESDESEVIYNTRRNPPQTLVDGTGSVFNHQMDPERGVLILYEGPWDDHYWLDCKTWKFRKTTRGEARKLKRVEACNFQHSAILNGHFRVYSTYPREESKRMKLPSDAMSLVLDYQDMNKKRTFSIRVVLPQPAKKDVNYSTYTKTIELFLENKRINHDYTLEMYFGEEYGYLDYSDHLSAELLGIFRVSDLERALRESTDF